MPKHASRQVGFGLALLATLMGGSSYVFSRIAGKVLNPESQLIYWYGFALIGNLMLIGSRRKLSQFWRKSNLKVFVFVGVLNTVFALLYYRVINHLGSSEVAFYFRGNTLLVIVLAAILFKERLNRREFLSMVVALGGAVVLTFSPEVHLSPELFLVAIAAVCIALTDLWSKQFVKAIQPEILSGIRLASTLLFCLIYIVLFGKLEPLTWGVLPAVFCGGVLSAFLRFYLYYEAVKRVEVSKVAVIMVFEPVVPVIMNLVLYNTLPSWQQLLGGSVITAGICLLVLASWSKNRVTTSVSNQIINP